MYFHTNKPTLVVEVTHPKGDARLLETTNEEQAIVYGTVLALTSDETVRVREQNCDVGLIMSVDIGVKIGYTSNAWSN